MAPSRDPKKTFTRCWPGIPGKLSTFLSKPPDQFHTVQQTFAESLYSASESGVQKGGLWTRRVIRKDTSQHNPKHGLLVTQKTHNQPSQFSQTRNPHALPQPAGPIWHQSHHPDQDSRLPMTSVPLLGAAWTEAGGQKSLGLHVPPECTCTPAMLVLVYSPRFWLGFPRIAAKMKTPALLGYKPLAEVQQSPCWLPEGGCTWLLSTCLLHKRVPRMEILWRYKTDAVSTPRNQTAGLTGKEDSH